MKTFLSWWKVWGQPIGFILLIAFLTTTLTSDYSRKLANQNEWFGIIWLVGFVGGMRWYVWQMKIHGWKLPKDIKDTH